MTHTTAPTNPCRKGDLVFVRRRATATERHHKTRPELYWQAARVLRATRAGMGTHFNTDLDHDFPGNTTVSAGTTKKALGIDLVRTLPEWAVPLAETFANSETWFHNEQSLIDAIMEEKSEREAS